MEGESRDSESQAQASNGGEQVKVLASATHGGDIPKSSPGSSVLSPCSPGCPHGPPMSPNSAVKIYPIDPPFLRQYSNPTHSHLFPPSPSVPNISP